MRMLYLCVCCWVRNSWSCLGATLPFPLTPSLLYHPTKFQTPKNTQIPISKETVTTRTIHIKKQLTHPPQKKHTHTLWLCPLFCSVFNHGLLDFFSPSWWWIWKACNSNESSKVNTTTYSFSFFCFYCYETELNFMFLLLLQSYCW
jgi:hypothetical protein